MAAESGEGGKSGSPAEQRRQRLADQLRRNLKRRKGSASEQGGESTVSGPEETVAPSKQAPSRPR